MFHATKSLENAALIEQNGLRASVEGLLGPGVYVSRDMEKAEQYREGGVMFEVLVRVGTVCYIKDHHVPVPVGSKWAELKRSKPDATQEMKAARELVPKDGTHAPWHDAGYDTAWVPADCSPWIFEGVQNSGEGHVEETCVSDASSVMVLRRVKWDTDRPEVRSIEWMWEEDSDRAAAHKPCVDREEWIGYSRENSIMIESHRLARSMGGRSHFIITIENGRKLFHEHTGMQYEIDLEKRTQKNVMTGFQRRLRRLDRSEDMAKIAREVKSLMQTDGFNAALAVIKSARQDYFLARVFREQLNELETEVKRKKDISQRRNAAAIILQRCWRSSSINPFKPTPLPDPPDILSGKSKTASSDIELCRVYAVMACCGLR